MPLQDQLPVIDDRTYADIVAEARSRIPRYTPEWTDVNESDPGMILVELFAWLSEIQIYRMNQVPKLNYLKFLELVGIELEPAKASTAHIHFPLQPGLGRTYTTVPAATQISTEEPDELGPIIFETDRALNAIRAELSALQSFDGVGFRDISRENDDTAVSFEAFGSLSNVGSALMIGFDEPLPDIAIGLFFWTPQGGDARIVNACRVSGQVVTTSTLEWEYWNGREWRRLDVLSDDTASFTRTGEVRIVGPNSGDMAAAAIGKVDEALYWIRARITKSDYQSPPRLLLIRTNIAPATQAETIQFEILGGSDGRMDQVLSLAETPVLAGSLTLQVNEGAGPQTWLEVPDLFGSGPDDPHYVLNRATGEVRFGDGVNGRIPVGNPRSPANIRALRYRVGGGTRGNVPADSLRVLQSSTDGIDANAAGNPFEAAGGANEESLESARKRAPQTLKSRNRAVTAEDFEELARRAANVARAKALPLRHPNFPGVEVPGVVTIVVVPELDTKKFPMPTPNEGTIQAVCAYLNERRLLTTEVYVTGPEFREVTIEAEVIAEDNADLAQVKAALLVDIRRYFDPLQGGEDSGQDRPGAGWPFGGDIFYSLLYRRLLLDGVKRLVSLTVMLDGEKYPACQDVSVPEGVLLSNGDHDIEVRYE